jgi:N6-L-threonylcarbamoyladenine synthase
MIVLGIETSCDETAASIVENGTTVLSNVIASQIDLHTKTGGVVPEIASREHIKIIVPVIDEALRLANKKIADIDLIAVSKTPGLIGSLLIGVETARTLAYIKNKDIVGVNHIAGHIYSNWLERDQSNFKFPLITLTASGGHNHIILVKNHYDFEILGRTRDDASGEAFDKVAKMLGLSYPGGPIVSKRALNGNKNRFKFPRAWIKKDSLEFSFSGLKTAVLRQIQSINAISDQDIDDICASFQEAVTEVLAEKLMIAHSKYSSQEIHLAGGVSANKRLRELVKEKAKMVELKIPLSMAYCTDNAAMIASAGYFQYTYKGADCFETLEPSARMNNF